MKFKAKKINRNSICCLNATGGGIIYTLVLEDHSLAKKGSLTRKELCPLPFPSLYVKYTSTN